MEGYELISNDFEKCNRGIIVYVRKDIIYSEIKEENEFQEMVNLQIKLKNNIDIVIGIIYRSPNSQTENDEELFKFI